MQDVVLPGDQRAQIEVVDPPPSGCRVAVLVPCFNEALTVATVVRDFAAALPDATVHVFDNNSTDDTGARAREAGAVVHRATTPGKGSVVRKMFSDVDADVYVMVDGDATYDAAAAPAMVDLLLRDGLDMVVGARVTEDADGDEYRSGHVLGNRLFTGLYQRLFDLPFTDVFSGYRVFTRRFVKSFPATTSGFDIETELIVHAADLQLEVGELPTRYGARPEGSDSKLSTYRDGARILGSAVRLYRNTYPRRFFGVLGLLVALIGVALGIPIIVEYLDTGLVPRFPTAFLAASLEVIALLLLTSGLIISSVRQVSREQRRLAYLAVPPPPPQQRDHHQR